MDEIKEQIQAAKEQAVATANKKALMYIELAEAHYDSAMTVAQLIRSKNFHLIEVESILLKSKMKAIHNKHMTSFPSGGFEIKKPSD